MSHSTRDEIEQNQHDNVIKNLAARLRDEEKLSVRTNPSKSKEYSVTRGKLEYYPDVYTYEERGVTRIYEVETKQTVNSGSVEQWRKYADGKSKFYLVVPKESLDLAKELVEKHNIKVDGFWTF